MSGVSSAAPVTSTFVLADLVGYTAMTEVHGDVHAADAAAELCRVARGLLDDYDAEEVKALGDAVLLRVPRADQAIQLAARLVAEHGARHRTLGLRVGMHTGEAVVRDGDWFGSAINITSRIADLAAADEILLSAATRAAARDALVAGQLRPRGRHRLKNVGDPIEVFALVPEGRSSDALPIDPVCRMAVDPDLAAEQIVHRGVTYHLCSDACADAFRRAPPRYADRRPGRGSLLVSDEARERAAGQVARAYTRGRIDADELEERTERAWAARSRSDLKGATDDLPRRRRRVHPLLWPVTWLLRSTAIVLRERRRRRRRELPR